MISIILLACQAAAGTIITTQTTDHAQVLSRGMRDKCNVAMMSCEGETCTLTCVEKPGKTWTFDDKQARRAAIKTRIEYLVRKIRNTPHPVTPAERDELLMKLAVYVLRQE